uniref:hypothetical protein n=1 Tax=Ornithobacterium rhinotracheale TaxID=28251 RepID=UPI0039A42E66
MKSFHVIFILIFLHSCKNISQQNEPINREVARSECLTFTDNSSLCDLKPKISFDIVDSIVVTKNSIIADYTRNFGKGFYLSKNENILRKINNKELYNKIYPKYIIDDIEEPTAINITQNGRTFYLSVIDFDRFKKSISLTRQIDVFIIKAYSKDKVENIVLIDTYRK